MKKSKNKSRKFMINIVIIFGCLLLTYLGMSINFINHFYFRSTINGINVSCKTVNDVDQELSAELKKYILKLDEKDNDKEEITAANIGLKYNSHDKIQSLKHNQNPVQWFYGLFNENKYKVSSMASYDENLLKECINNLSCCNPINAIKPKNPGFKYTHNGYEIIKEANGNKVNKDILYTHVANAISKGETTINLETINCYENPKYTSNSKEIIATKNLLDKYVSSKITYTFGERTEILDGSTINTWLKVDENLEIIFDKEKVTNYIDKLADTYDTSGKTRDFVTLSGKSVKVSGGDYGWLINKSKEAEDLITAVKKGQAITKQPIYKQTALFHGTNDIGNTYVEIDILRQYLWFYKNGSLVVKGNVVTGNESSNHSTPVGVYNLEYKQKDTVLRGTDYSSPVSFWMPFNGGIGIHDATWRTDFGGQIYETNGSHGCINAPYYIAEAIFYNIEEGTPIICHS